MSVRFDPFDLSRIRVYHKGVYIDTVGPYEMRSNTFRKALSRRQETPAHLESATAYRKQLSRNHRQRLHERVALTNTSDRGADCLTRSELLGLLSERLGGRILTPAEGHAAADFFIRYAPLLKHVVEAALHLAIEEKGSGRHLRFYLDAIRAARPGKERS